MSIVSQAVGVEEGRAVGGRTVDGVVNSFETLEGGGFFVHRPFPRGGGGRDPLEEARKRIHAQRRAEARIQILAKPGEARQDDETALPVDNS